MGVDGISADLSEGNLTSARFHDLRQTFVTNARRAKIDYFRILVITGHKALRVLQPYNRIDEGDLQEAMTTPHTYLAHRDMHTSMDTTPSTAIMPRWKNVVNPGN